MAIERKTVNYCYNCGRRLSKQQDHCLHCNAPIREHIRPPKRCQFCGEEVHPSAVKCRHCGEFLDGRVAQPAGTVHNYFLVDKNLLHAARDYRLLAGQPVPPDIARLLEPQTVRAIEANRPDLVQQPGVQSLPAPAEPPSPRAALAGAESSGMVDISLEPRPGLKQLEGPANENPVDEAPRDLVRGEHAGAANLPARRGEDIQPPAIPALMNAGLSVGNALARVGRRMMGGPRAGRSTDIDSRARDVFRICENCQTEILSSDNFCYYCGMQYHMSETDLKREYQRRNVWRRLLNRFLHVLIIAIIVLLLAMRFGKVLEGYSHLTTPAIVTGYISCLLLLIFGLNMFNRAMGLVWALTLFLLGLLT